MNDKQDLLNLLDGFQLGYTEEGNNIILREGNNNVIGRDGYEAAFGFTEKNAFDELKIHKQ